MKLRLPSGLPALAVLVLAACSGSTNAAVYAGPSAPATSGSASAGAAGPIWVLSPVGLSLRDNPDPTAKVLSTIPQGTQLAVTEFRAGSPGWYHVTFNAVAGWVAAEDVKSVPHQALVTTRAQLAYSNLSAGYYFLYPSTWRVNEKGDDVELDGPPPDGSSSPQPQASGQGPVAGVTPDKLTFQLAPSLDKLGAEPTTPGANLDTVDFEVGGVTAVKRTFTLAGGGYEGDAKVRFAADRAMLVTMRTGTLRSLDIFTEVLESVGFSAKPATPAPSP